MISSSISCQLYLVHLGKEQIAQVYSRQKIDQLIQDENVDGILKDQLKFVQTIREFAIRELALSHKGGYKYYVHLEREELGWNVSASYPLEFKSYTWWFPISGTVPYKGYFNLKMAEEEESNLKSLGLDTRLRITGGYSTLGWLSDPIYSSQMKLNKPRLAGLVIHEMAHATVYIPGDTQFNESYANFIENLGVELYYSKFDPKDIEYLKEVQNKENQKLTLTLVKETAETLDSIYKSERSDIEKLQAKKGSIQNFLSQALQMGLVHKNQKDRFLNKDWNNEDFIGVLRYKSGDAYFQKIYQEVGYDLAKFHNRIQEYRNLTPEEKKNAME